MIALAGCGSQEQKATPMPIPVVPKTGIVSRTTAQLTGMPALPNGERVTGQVLDEQRRPISGADVVLRPGDRHAISGADGEYAFDHVSGLEYQLAARVGDRFAVGSRAEPTLVLRGGSTLLVHVVADGSPLEGATVTADGRVIAKSDRSGAARIGGVGWGLVAEISASGRAPTPLWGLARVEPGETLEKTVELRPGAALSGVVFAPTGEAVADATVEIEEIAELWRGKATTDPHGAWHFDALAAGRYMLRATSKLYGPTPDASIELDGVTPRRDLVVRVAVNAQIVGTVYDTGGRPIAGATVTARPEDLFPDHTQLTGPDGRFAIFGLVAGEYDVGARTTRKASPMPHVTIAEGERVEVALVADDSSIMGTIVDTSGVPIVGAQVTMSHTYVQRSGTGFASRGFASSAVTSQGHFDLGGLEPGEYELGATWPDLVDGISVERLKVMTGTHDVKLVLAAPTTLTGRVLLDGAPLPHFGIAVANTSMMQLLSPRVVRTTDGRFTLRPVKAGTFSVVIMGPGTERKTIENVVGTPGQAVALGDISLARGLRISGHVRDQAGVPVAGAIVAIGRGQRDIDMGPLAQAFRGEFQTTTDATGAYAFDGVAPMRERFEQPKISASHRVHGISAPATIPDKDAKIDLVIVATGAIDGVVAGASSGSVSARIGSSPSAFRVFARIDGTGAFHFDRLLPGVYTISMYSEGREKSSIQVTVVAGQRAAAKL
jgi:protocatechuate 3,4-dioxygenase beta subunit